MSKLNESTVDARCAMLADHAVLTVVSHGPVRSAYRSVREIADELIRLRTQQAAQSQVSL